MEGMLGTHSYFLSRLLEFARYSYLGCPRACAGHHDINLHMTQPRGDPCSSIPQFSLGQ